MPPAARTLLKKGSGLPKLFVHGTNSAIRLSLSCPIFIFFCMTVGGWVPVFMNSVHVLGVGFI
jgi:hypothetical protein